MILSLFVWFYKFDFKKVMEMTVTEFGLLFDNIGNLTKFGTKEFSFLTSYDALKIAKKSELLKDIKGL